MEFKDSGLEAWEDNAKFCNDNTFKKNLIYSKITLYNRE